MKKKCLLIIQNLSKSGSPLTFYHIIKALESSCDIDVVVTSALNESNDLVYLNQYKAKCNSITLLKINTHKFINRLFPYFAYRKVATIIKRNNYDFIISNILEVSSLIIRKKLNLNSYFYSLDSLDIKSKYKIINKRKLKMIKNVETSNHFIALTPSCCSKNFDFNHNKFSLLLDYPEIELKNDKKSFNPNRIVMGLIGYFCDKKNQLYALNILDKLRNLKDSILILMGYHFDFDNEYFNEMKNYIETNYLQDRVIFLDKNSSKEDFFDSIDILLCPSKYEGLGLVILESQYRKCPVLASDCVPIETQLGGAAYLSLDNIDNWINYLSGEKFKTNFSLIENSSKEKFENDLNKILF